MVSVRAVTNQIVNGGQGLTRHGGLRFDRDLHPA
jgi:hypothetical protein